MDNVELEKQLIKDKFGKLSLNAMKELVHELDTLRLTEQRRQREENEEKFVITKGAEIVKLYHTDEAVKFMFDTMRKIDIYLDAYLKFNEKHFENRDNNFWELDSYPVYHFASEEREWTIYVPEEADELVTAIEDDRGLPELAVAYKAIFPESRNTPELLLPEQNETDLTQGKFGRDYFRRILNWNYVVYGREYLNKTSSLILQQMEDK